MIATTGGSRRRRTGQVRGIACHLGAVAFLVISIGPGAVRSVAAPQASSDTPTPIGVATQNDTIPFTDSAGGLVLSGDLAGKGARDVALRAAGGYWILGVDQIVHGFGGAPDFADLAGLTLNSPPARVVASPVAGVYVVSADGGVFAVGGAPFFGSMGATKLNAPVVSMAPTPTGLGYWLVASDGGIFSFGDAAFKGSLPAELAKIGRTFPNKPVIGLSATPTGQGYFMVASDGGVFAFGDAPFLGSLGGTALANPIVDMATNPSGGGYYVASTAGQTWPFGTAQAYGSAIGLDPTPFVGIDANQTGYLMVASSGKAFSFDQNTPPAGGTTGAGVTSDQYNFFGKNPQGGAARWNPCVPIRYEVNFNGSQPSARADLASALAKMTQASGLQFVKVREIATFTKSSDVDAIISWKTANEYPKFAMGSAGFGSASWRTANGRIFAGEVGVNAQAPLMAGYGTINSLGEVLLHELGHMVGLNHVNDVGQVMYPQISRLTDYGPGDRAGLILVGASQGCLTD